MKDEDIVQVFPADDPNLQRVYVQFSHYTHADFCMSITRQLRKPKSKLDVALFVPREIKARFNVVSHEAWLLRKRTTPPLKTRIEYSEDDILLFTCPDDHWQYFLHQVPNLPPVNLAPVRTPPPGRKTKRPRSDSSSPKIVEKKKERVEVSSASASSTGSRVNEGTTSTEQPGQDTEQHLN